MSILTLHQEPLGKAFGFIESVWDSMKKTRQEQKTVASTTVLPIEISFSIDTEAIVIPLIEALTTAFEEFKESCIEMTPAEAQAALNNLTPIADFIETSFQKESKDFEDIQAMKTYHALSRLAIVFLETYEVVEIIANRGEIDEESEDFKLFLLEQFDKANQGPLLQIGKSIRDLI